MHSVPRVGVQRGVLVFIIRVSELIIRFLPHPHIYICFTSIGRSLYFNISVSFYGKLYHIVCRLQSENLFLFYLDV
jgi:hypothetical protein